MSDATDKVDAVTAEEDVVVTGLLAIEELEVIADCTTEDDPEVDNEEAATVA